MLVAHFAMISEGFLDAACRRLWGAGMPCLTVDTLEVERRLRTTWMDRPAAGSLRLWAARERYGLPQYRAHDALLDAIACAELFAPRWPRSARAARCRCAACSADPELTQAPDEGWFRGLQSPVGRNRWIGGVAQRWRSWDWDIAISSSASRTRSRSMV